VARVELEHVEKVYPDGTLALVDCTLAIDDGELIVVVGPSGCGKSTLLRLVAGLETATSGTLRIGERIVNEMRPQERNVAMVFQDYALYPYLTARGNLEFPLKMRRLSRQQIGQRVERTAALLAIEELLGRLPRQLSGGQRQRVAMGRALVREPAVFLLDEPLSNLDAKLRVQVRAELKELQQRMQTTMIYVTHDQVEAMTLGHRVVVLNQGRLQQVASPRDLYQRPANAFVAGFIGNPPMNLLSARFSLDERARMRIEIAGQTLILHSAALPRERFRSLVGSALTIGIRPEAARLETVADGRLSATVQHLENLGHETLAHVRLGHEASSQVLIIRVQEMLAFAPGDAVGVEIDPSRVHLFGENGVALPI
jgi:multiple sugar transport system ATP-binding protein